MVWDHTSGVPLVHAVAASSAFPGAEPPVGVQGQRYMDGALRAGPNADLAAGARSLAAGVPGGPRPGARHRRAAPSRVGAGPGVTGTGPVRTGPLSGLLRPGPRRPPPRRAGGPWGRAVRGCRRGR
ncbi:patatin-like phospholipase family protein [Streptomyces sp. NBC_00096]|uniref:patatin-like phospholipase family protein n=1 Tax=Streptomyces sp. NBC_00096 TaxID=2975650 RepID=UPI003867D444